jgi:AcrR family transcriptional regulator
MAKTAKPAKVNGARTDAAGVDRTASYLDGGRVSQKLRTRDALVSGAADLIRRGQPVSVTEVADAARVSRTTAYRYFPTSEMLSAQASLFVAGSIETQHLDDIIHGTGTSEEKLDAVIAGSDAMTAAYEQAFRTLLRFSLEAGASKGLPRRPPFRRQWIETALADVKKELGLKRFNRLSGALSLLCGVESFVVLKDICAMAPDEAREAKRWAAQLLLRAALAESEDARVSGVKGKKGQLGSRQ